MWWKMKCGCGKHKYIHVQNKLISNFMKIYPLAFQSGQGSNSQPTTSQTNRWDQHLGVFRTSHDQPKDRKALTAALVHFSKALG